MIMLIIESRTEMSLPYLVYNIKTVSDVNPMIKKNQAKTAKGKDGMPAMSCKYFFCNLYF